VRLRGARRGQVPQGRHCLTGHGQQNHSRTTAHRGEEATTVEATSCWFWL
jgi:hypothetical protein